MKIDKWNQYNQKGWAINRDHLLAMGKTPVKMSLTLIGFKLLSEQGLYAPGHWLWPTDPKMGIIYMSWPAKTPIMVPLSLIVLKVLSGQGFYAQCHCEFELWHTEPKINRDYLLAMAI